MRFVSWKESRLPSIRSRNIFLAPVHGLAFLVVTFVTMAGGSQVANNNRVSRFETYARQFWHFFLKSELPGLDSVVNGGDSCEN